MPQTYSLTWPGSMVCNASFLPVSVLWVRIVIVIIIAYGQFKNLVLITSLLQNKQAGRVDQTPTP